MEIAFQQEDNKILHVGMLKPVQDATPWINSFVLVEGKLSQVIPSLGSAWIQQI